MGKGREQQGNHQRVTVVGIGHLSRQELGEALKCSRHPTIKQDWRLDKVTNTMIRFCSKCEEELAKKTEEIVDGKLAAAGS